MRTEAVTFANVSVNTVSNGASGEVLAANPNRQALIIHNPSATYKVAIAIGADAAINGYQSITLAPGGSWVVEGLACPTNAINARSGNASATGLMILEA